MQNSNLVPYIILVAPAILAVILYIFPVSGMIIGGIVVVYAGVAMAAFLGQLPLYGAALFAAGVGVGVAGISMITYGVLLSALERALERLPAKIADELNASAFRPDSIGDRRRHLTGQLSDYR